MISWDLLARPLAPCLFVFQFQIQLRVEVGLKLESGLCWFRVKGRIGVRVKDRVRVRLVYAGKISSCFR